MNKDDLKSIIPIDKVYDDVLSPAMKQIGKSLESVAKTSRFLLAPIDYLASQHDRWEKYLSKVAAKVKDENLIEGHPQIVIPALEGLTLTEENTLLNECFINLLATSIDSSKRDLAHPAFPIILKQLSHDEAVILFLLNKNNSYFFEDDYDWNEKGGVFINERRGTDSFPLKKLSFPHHIDLYMDRLSTLNLAAVFQRGDKHINYDEITKKQVGCTINFTRTLLEFGGLFAQSCIPAKFDSLDDVE
jgi:hypothetical protein